MARRKKAATPRKSRVSKVKEGITRAAKKLTSKLRPRQAEPKAKAAPVRPRKKRGDGSAARPTRRQTDVPLEAIEHAYTPMQTSLKASFRTSGADRQKDQDAIADSRWNDEDHYTNRSGDPRIGTHHRKYEPGE